MTETATPTRTTNNQRILQAIVECQNANKVCTRKVIMEMTGLKQTIVDDHVKRLKADEVIFSAMPGVFEPTKNLHEDRLVSTTFLQDGMVKVEIGDNVLIVSMREARWVWMGLGGIAHQFGR